MPPGPGQDIHWEWTVSETPFAEPPEAEPARRDGERQPAAGPPVRAPKRPAPSARQRRLGWLTAGLVAALLAGQWANTTATRLLQEQALRQTVAQEEQAALAGDVDGVRQLSDPAGGVWLEQRLERVAAGQPAPAPLGLLHVTRTPGAITAITPVDPDITRVEVTRLFADPAGRLYPFTLPQFYRRSAAGWRRLPPPETFWAGPELIVGRRVALGVTAVDADWARALLPGLDDLLARFCADVGCPAGVITLTLAHNAYWRPEVPELRGDDPLLLGLLPPVVSRYPAYTLLLPSPHDVGYPAEAAGAELLRRAVATQLLYTAADRAAFGSSRLEPVGNIYFLALVARLTARYGLDLEAARVTRSPLPAEVSDPRILWDFRFGATRRADLIRYALGELNAWLAGQSPETELRLLRTSGLAVSLASWLAAGQTIGSGSGEVQ